MSIIEDLKLQYKIGGIVNRLIYWNVGLFLMSIVFFYKFKSGGFFYPEWLAIFKQVQPAQMTLHLLQVGQGVHIAIARPSPARRAE